MEEKRTKKIFSFYTTLSLDRGHPIPYLTVLSPKGHSLFNSSPMARTDNLVRYMKQPTRHARYFFFRCRSPFSIDTLRPAEIDVIRLSI